ncbi:hypothetical protein BDQ17DRAFT_1424425 [Cyathus striatus]|nr:hypothetical protein BDQ17DRAFT_1424425 [Cyathus striatus]
MVRSLVQSGSDVWSNYDPCEGVEPTLPLWTYLSEVQFPVFSRPDKPSLVSMMITSESAPQWPHYKELLRPTGTRKLQQVQRIPFTDFVRATREYLDVALRDVFLENENMVREEVSTTLHLPSRGAFVDYGDDDVSFLSNIENEDDLSAVMEHYVLRTASECIRLIQKLPPLAPMSRALDFKLSNHLCTAHHARWDIFALPSDASNIVPVVILFIPPWNFTHTDFEEFLMEQGFRDGSLDTLEDEDNRKSHTLWAVLQDICRSRGHRFVVTNYLRWAYGLFEDDYMTANVTDSYEVSVRDFDGKFNSTLAIGCNPIEFLVYWIQRSRGMAHSGND